MKNEFQFLTDLGISTSNNKNEIQVNTELSETVNAILDATHTNWEVIKTPSTFDFKGETKVYPDKFANVRSDNGEPLGLVGKDYTILQNREAVQTVLESTPGMFDAAGEFKHPWDNTAMDSGKLGSHGNFSGGYLKGGEYIFYQLGLPEEYIGKSGIQRYITLGHAHNGNASLFFGFGNQVVCCRNTYEAAQRELSKLRHTASMKERVNEAREVFSRMIQEESKQIEIFKLAAKKALKPDHIFELENVLFDNFNKKKEEDQTTRSKNIIADFRQDVKQSIDEQGHTLWALFNGVTRYTNHTRNTKDKEFSLMFGGDRKLNAQAAQFISALV